MAKSVLFSAIQPTGELMIGNYFGAIRNWVRLQREHECWFSLADLHALTTRPTAVELQRRCYDFLALFLACGIDPAESRIFVQSQVPAHAQLAWLLNCCTTMGELRRMTQFKEKSGRPESRVNAGLFDYPVLMAADILLYRTQQVPVGEDQRQHLELTRTLARRFNQEYGEVFTVPEALIPESGARIMSLKDPRVKMSKSDTDPANFIALLDPPDVIREKIQHATTDSGHTLKADPVAQPGIANLIVIYSLLTQQPMASVEKEFRGRDYRAFKEAVSEALIHKLQPIQGDFAKYRRDTAGLRAVLEKSAEDARQRSAAVLKAVHERLGLLTT